MRSDSAPDQLPNGEDLIEGESLPGFLKRMGNVNGFANPMRMIRPLRPEFSTLRGAAIHAHRSEELGDYLALGPGELERMCYGDGRFRRIHGVELAHHLVSLEPRKACPLCMEESLHHRAVWDVVLVTCCPVHAVRLVDRCACGRCLRWGPEPLTGCRNFVCIGDVRDAEVRSVPEVDMVGVVGLDRILRGIPTGLGAAAEALAPGERALLAFHLGLLSLGWDRVTRPLHFSRAHADEVHLVLAEGWRACLDWPVGFHRILEGRRSLASGRGGRFGVQHAFGRVHRWVENRGEAPFVQLLRSELTEFILRCPDLATRAPDLRRARSAAVLHLQHATLREGMDLLGVGHEAMRTLADERGLYIVPPTGKGAPALLRADLLHQLHAERSRLLSKAEVSRMLGIGKKTVVKLHEAGLVTAQPSAEDPDVVVYTRESVEALLAVMKAHLPQPAQRSPRSALTAAGVARTVNIPGYDSADVVRAVMDGLIAPVAVSPRRRGLHRFLFRRADAERLGAGVAGQRATMSVDEAARQLGVKQEVAYHWVRTGRLAVVQGTTRDEAGRRVTDASLARFRAEFVTGTEVAKRFGLGVRWVSVHLRERGIQAVSGPGVDGARQYLFRRADLVGVRKSALVSGSAKRSRHLAQGKRMTQSRSAGLRLGLSADVRRLLGAGYVPSGHSVLGGPGGRVVIRIMLAGNMGVVGTYRFLFSCDYVERLEAAKRAYLVLGFSDQRDFLLVPWLAFKSHVEALGGPPANGYLPVVLRATPDKTIWPFGEYACSRRFYDRA